MIEVTNIPTEIQARQKFTITGTATPERKGKALTVTVDNQFKIWAGVVNADGAWRVECQFQQPGERRLGISVEDESKSLTIKVIAVLSRLRFTKIPSLIKAEESFSIEGEAQGFEDNEQLILKADKQFVLARPRVKNGKWQAALLFHRPGKRLVEVESSEQERAQIELDVKSTESIFQVVARSEWTSQPTPESISNLVNPKRITFHHFFIPSEPAASESAEKQRMRDVRNAEMSNPTQRFSDIGYHYVIMASGRVYEGRSERKRGAHDVINDGIGIAFDGDYTTRTITDAQFKSAVALCTKLCQRMGITNPVTPVMTPTADFGTIPLPRICGHRDRVATGCPGTEGGRTVRLAEIRQAVKEALNS